MDQNGLMNSYDSDNIESLKGAVLAALSNGLAEEPQIEAELILDYLNRNERQDRRAVDSVLRDLARGVSTYHVLGEYSVPDTKTRISVNKGVIPPGIDTKFVIQALHKLASAFDIRWMVDIGCGTGVLGIAFLVASCGSQGILIDIDMNACRAASGNIHRVGLKDRALVVCGDAVTFLIDHCIDLVVANLPFVPTSQVQLLPNQFRKFVPVTAIDGGDDGLQLFRSIIPQIVRALRPCGIVLLQTGIGQKHEVAQMMGPNWKILDGRDYNHPAILVAQQLT